jgi:hypothetical protein
VHRDPYATRKALRARWMKVVERAKDWASDGG